jgi:hypothetical protein
MTPRFVFAWFHNGRPIVGPVRGCGGMVASLERLQAARRLAIQGRPHGLYEPILGHVAVFPDYSSEGDGEPVFVPVEMLAGPHMECEVRQVPLISEK